MKTTGLRGNQYGPGDGVVIGLGFKVDVLESLGNEFSCVRIVVSCHDCVSADVLVVGALEVKLNGDVGGQNEIRVYRAQLAEKQGNQRQRGLTESASAIP